LVFTGSDVARLQSEAGSKRGSLPGRIRVDNGTEFTSKALDHWAYWNWIQLDFNRPGKPNDNAFIESFNATLRRECLPQHWFLTLTYAQRTLNG
jgi:putative transposase